MNQQAGYASALRVSDASTGTQESQQPQAADTPTTFNTPRELLSALAEQDKQTTTLAGGVRYTIINALENDRQTRYGNLAIRNADNEDAKQARKYAVRFSGLELGDRFDEIDEHYIFDGRWFVERMPEEKQFNKRELVPQGETLDPMELMRDAPFWVSLGRDQERLLKNYEATILPTGDGLVGNADFPELALLADKPHVQGSTQLMLEPRDGSGFEDDWESVRIWVNPDTLLPALYIKQDWTGDLQIVELFEPKRNTEIPAAIFDTTTPDATSGWRVQISHWRGDKDNAGD
ncbi:MAG: LolA family protein [Phycisphaerales bacterium]